MMPEGATAMDHLSLWRHARAKWPRFRYGDRFGVGCLHQRDFTSLREIPDDSMPPGTWISVSFDPGVESWPDFGRIRIWQPELEWCVSQGADPAPAGILARLSATTSDKPCVPGIEALSAQNSNLAQAEWARRVGQAGRQLRDPSSELRKVVLARSRVIRHEATQDELDLMKRLRPADQDECPWLIDWNSGWSWWGMSPELLVAQQGRELRSMALAGTRSRGMTSIEDNELGKDLLSSEKDRTEHHIVVDWIQRQLGKLGTGTVTQSETRLRKLNRLQHLYCELRVKTEKQCSPRELLQTLHPSPALCGDPRPLALNWLREHEGLDRGLYGGVVGRVTEQGFSAHVMIRGLLSSKRVSRGFAGTGLVADSDAHSEWEESSQKLDAMSRLLFTNQDGEYSS